MLIVRIVELEIVNPRILFKNYKCEAFEVGIASKNNQFENS